MQRQEGSRAARGSPSTGQCLQLSVLGRSQDLQTASLQAVPEDWLRVTLELSWAQWGLEVWHCGRSPRSYNARAGTPAKTPQPWVTMPRLGYPKMKSSREKSARSRYQQKKDPQCTWSNRQKSSCPQPQSSCASQAELRQSTASGENRGI